MDSRLRVAVLNNAGWCDAVCRSHGLPTVFSERMWIAPGGSPRFYPDAVTLAPGLAPDLVLSLIDSGPGCSVKDSFSDLDLSAHGFHVLFEAEWLFRPSTAPGLRTRLGWQIVTNNDDLERWAAAAELRGVIRSELLNDPAVSILIAGDGQSAINGAIVFRDTATIGVSNVLTVTSELTRCGGTCPLL